MIFSCVSQVNIHAGKTSSLGMVLAENERTSGQQQQDRRNDKKQFFHRRYNTSILNKISITVGRNSRSGAPSAHNREARASGLLWFAPLVCHTSAGGPLSRPSQCAHWLALRSMRQHRPALTADGQRSMFPARGANRQSGLRIVRNGKCAISHSLRRFSSPNAKRFAGLPFSINVRCDSHSVTEPAA